MDASSAKPKFRARKLEPGRPLKIIRFDEVEEEDVEELLAPSMRAAVVISTGVDKEEEEEEHLQAALTTAMVAPKDQQYVIPTPKVDVIASDDYDTLYPAGTWKMPKAYLKAASRLRLTDTEHQVPDPKEVKPKYNADALDVLFCQRYDVDIIFFEALMEWCYAGNPLVVDQCTSNLPWIADAQKSLIPLIFEHFKTAHSNREVKLKHEDLGKIGADPYVCFRRRELRLPRKTRRSDAQCIDRIKKLRYELETIKTAMTVAHSRDIWRLEGLQLEKAIFEKYVQVEEMKELKVRLPESLQNMQPFKQAIAPPLPQIANPTVSPSRRRNRAGTRRPEAKRPAFKLTLPSVAFKSLKYSRPYYPIEMLKLLQRDLDGIATGPNDPLVNGWKQTVFKSDPDALYYRPAPVDLPNTCASQGAVRVRRGRAGRLLVDYEPDYMNAFVDPSAAAQSSIINNRPDLATRLSLLSLKECAQLNNQNIGNYNHHYIQSTVHLTKPYTFFGWLTATSAMQAASTSGSSGNLKTGSKPNSKNSSPKRNSSKPDSPALSTNQTPSASTTPQPKPSPPGLGNIIVKVKKNAGDAPNHANQTPVSNNHATQPSYTNGNPGNPSKRFTPTGLSPGE